MLVQIVRSLAADWTNSRILTRHWTMDASTHSPALTPAHDMTERRKRRPVSLRGYIALEGGETVEIQLLDLSYDGCGIETPIPLGPGQTITLSVPGRGAIEADVRWCRLGKAGLVFRPEPETSKSHRPRKTKRMPLTAEVRLRRLGGSNYRVSVFDLSTEGCKIELIERPSTGEHMLIKFEGLEALDAEVCWLEGFRGGLRFEKSIHPAVFDLLLTRLQP
jgi:PilZ domain